MKKCFTLNKNQWCYSCKNMPNCKAFADVSILIPDSKISVKFWYVLANLCWLYQPREEKKEGNNQK